MLPKPNSLKIKDIIYILKNKIDNATNKSLLVKTKDNLSKNFLIKKLCFDFKEIKKNNELFFAIKGDQYDGHLQLKKISHQKNPLAVVVENDKFVPIDYKGVIINVSNTRIALSLIADNFYNHPSKKLFCIGITGTNGKTTVSYLLQEIFNKNNITSGVIGTIGVGLGNKRKTTGFTTPHAILLNEILQKFSQENSKIAIMEVSSHALAQSRVNNVDFNLAVFTNLSRDHMDYHKNYENYFTAKLKLFEKLLVQSSKKPLYAVINSDDPYAKKIKIHKKIKLITYSSELNWKNSFSEKSFVHFSYKILSLNFAETSVELIKREKKNIINSVNKANNESNINNEKIVTSFKVIGEYNIYNCLAAIASAYAYGIPIEKSVLALKNFNGCPGRLESIQNKKNIHIYVDYAHTPDALKKVLQTLKKMKMQSGLQKNKIILVFGCGGERDILKRPQMGKVADKYADVIFLTNDNPRSEDSYKIIRDILRGIKDIAINSSVNNNSITNKNKNDNKNKFQKIIVELDRKKAIKAALKKSGKNDIILIAGKGHENYQIVGTKKNYFDDKKVIKSFL